MTSTADLAPFSLKIGSAGAWYDHFRMRGDPLADAVVEAFRRLPHGAGEAMLRQALEGGLPSVPDAPEALRALLQEVDQVPPWVDRERIAAGGYTFLRCRLGFLVLACASLPLVYSLPRLNKVLVSSGRLVHMAAPRLKETTLFVFETCRAGGMERFADGFKLTVRVRLIHAQVRRLLLETGNWNVDQWGVPINQAHLAVTNVLFSHGALEGLRRLGYLFTQEQADAVVHLWRYSGYLSGIEEEILPDTEAEARRLKEAVFAQEGAPDADSRALVAGVMEAALAYARFGSVRVPYGISRALLGAEQARALGYPETPWRLLVPGFRPAATLIELCRVLNVPGVRALARVCGTQMFRHMMSPRGLPGKMGEFELPQELLSMPGGKR